MNPNSPRIQAAQRRCKEAMKPYKPSNKVPVFDPTPLTEEQRKNHEEQDEFLHGTKKGHSNFTGD